MANVDPIGITENSLNVSLFLVILPWCVYIVFWISSPESQLIGAQFTFGIRHLMDLLKSRITGLGSAGQIWVDLIFTLMSLFASVHFFIKHLMKILHALACAFLWWLYDDSIVCCIFNLRQNSLNISTMKLVLALDIIFFGNP